MIEKISQIESALKQLGEVLEVEPTEIVKDATIQRFEFTYELAWHLLKKAAFVSGIEVSSPREAFRVGAQLGLIDSVDIWFGYLDNRNSTVHIYDRSIADQVYGEIKNFYQDCLKMVEKVKSLV